MFCTAIPMYRFIERPFVQSDEGRTVNFWRYSGAFWSIILTLVAVTHATFLSKGFAWRLPAERAKLAHLLEFPSGQDILPVDGPFGMHLVGDSHAIQYMAGLSPLTKLLGRKMEILATPGCPILFGVALRNIRRQECILARDRSLERISQTTLPIIFVQKWDFYDDATIDYDLEDSMSSRTDGRSYAKLEKALDQTIGQLAMGGHRILIIGSQVESGCTINLPRLLEGPLPHAPPTPCADRERKEVEKSGNRFNEMLAAIQAKWPDRIELLRPVDYLCGEECPTVKEGLWLYRDGSHFTVAGSNYMVARAAVPIVEFLRAQTDLER
jgi:SGNH domain (fused to AT3 domains)